MGNLLTMKYFLVILFSLITSLCLFASLLFILSMKESFKLKEQLLSPSNKDEGIFPTKLMLEFSSEL